MENQFLKQYESMDFGTTVTTSGYDQITVEIDPDVMIDDYSDAVVADLQRRNPTRYAAINAQREELEKDPLDILVPRYVRILLAIRVESIKGSCPNWRQARELNIPPYIQYVLSQIGEVNDIDRGLKITPSFDYEYDINEALEISSLIESFTGDSVVLLKDAFPRSRQGDKETMSLAIIDNYVKGIDRTHPAKSYITVFLGMKLKEETELRALYRIRYDDIDFVRSMLLNEVAKW